MSTKHTQGPWKVEYLKNDDETKFELNRLFRGEGLYSFGSIDGTLAGITMTNSEASQANAQLIAAAPELLRELKSAILFIETYGGEVTERFAAGGNLEIVKSILKKAEGES